MQLTMSKLTLEIGGGSKVKVQNAAQVKQSEIVASLSSQ